MRIAQVCYLAAPALGGVERHVLELSRTLINNGHKVEIHTSNFYDLKGTSLPKLATDEIPTYRYSSKFVKKTTLFSQPIHFPGLFWGLVKSNPDLIHVHSMASLHLELSYLYCRLFHKPLVVTGHYSAADLQRLYTKRKNDQKTKRLRYWETRLKQIMNYTTLVAITTKEAQMYQELFDFKKVIVIPNGVNLEEFNPYLNKENYLLFVGRIVPEKRLDFLLGAYKKLLNKQPLIIAGYAPDKAYLDYLKGLASTGVSFVSPSRNQIVSLINQAKTLVLPSKNEAFGIVLLEAMASGVPVLASNSGGFPEVLGDAGLLFDPDSETDLVEKIELIQDKELYQKLATAGLKRVERFSWSTIAKELEEVYQSLV